MKKLFSEIGAHDMIMYNHILIYVSGKNDNPDLLYLSLAISTSFLKNSEKK